MAEHVSVTDTAVTGHGAPARQRTLVMAGPKRWLSSDTSEGWEAGGLWGTVAEWRQSTEVCVTCIWGTDEREGSSETGQDCARLFGMPQTRSLE